MGNGMNVIEPGLADCAERTSVYRLLARLWTEEPGGLLSELNQQPLRSVWQQLGGFVPDYNSEEVSAALDEVYCRLFVGPSQYLPPVQSVWVSGELDTKATASLREFDSIIGFDPPWTFAVIPDHLGNELWAMSQILVKSDGLPPDELAVAVDLASRFFAAHLCWADELLAQVVAREGIQFYGTVAAITGQFLQDEAARFLITAK